MSPTKISIGAVIGGAAGFIILWTSSADYDAATRWTTAILVSLGGIITGSLLVLNMTADEEH